MKEVDSLALTDVDKALGLAGPGARVTELEDGLISQVLDVNRLVARARSPIPSASKLGWAVFENVHAAADTQVTALDPYFQGSSPGVNSHWPVPVTSGFDVWVFSVFGKILSGSVSNMAHSYFGSVENAGDLLFGQNQAGAAPGGDTMRAAYMIWDSGATKGGQNFMVQSSGDRSWSGNIGVRIPRDSTLEFRSTSTGAVTCAAYVFMGIYPIGMPTDATT